MFIQTLHDISQGSTTLPNHQIMPGLPFRGSSSRFELRTGYIEQWHPCASNTPERANRTQRFGSSHSDQQQRLVVDVVLVRPPKTQLDF